MKLRISSLALAVSLLWFGCDEIATQEHQSAAGLNTVVDTFLIDGRATPAAVKGREGEASERTKGDSDKGIGLTWGFTPSHLQVFRSTAIHLKVDALPPEHPNATCSWNFGDGSPVEEGCVLSHTYHGGRGDQQVTLTLREGDWSWSSSRSVPLERLEVTKDEAKSQEGDLGIPKAPEEGDTSLRFAIIADTAAEGGVPESVQKGVESIVTKVKPQLVIHAGGLSTSKTSESDISAHRKTLIKITEQGEAKMAWGRSPIDRELKVDLRGPKVQMIDERHYPDRYSFTLKGAYFLVVSAGGPEGVDEEVIKWMRKELSKAGIYDARYVVSYLPLHKFGDSHVGSLDKRFRLYELFLRARVTSFFSAAYRVYYNGHYGALPVVSIGAMAGEGGKLAGSDFAQPNSFVVVDQVRGAKESVFALKGPDFDTMLDEDMLPENVEVYTR